MDSNAIKRFLWLSAFTAAFVVVGLVTLDGSNLAKDGVPHNTYRLIAMFALNGEWAFDEDLNPLLAILAFVAPLAAVVGIIELLGKSLIGRVREEWKLRSMRDHVVVFGLTNESIRMIEGIQNGPNPPQVVVIGAGLNDEDRLYVSKVGAVLLDGLGTPEERFSRAAIERADVLISFTSDTDDSLTLLSDLDSYLSERGRMRGRDPLDFWIKIANPKLGERLAEYFGLTDLQKRLHPRFFSLEETAARRLWRKHPLDAYAEAQGQAIVHLCVYGFDPLAAQVMSEAIRQTLPVHRKRMRITILTDDPEHTREQLMAWRPGIFHCGDVAFQRLPFHKIGISDADYERLPHDATAHVVCHDDPDAAAATALSLRRLLLAEPPGVETSGIRRLNAPILVRFDKPTGIGQLLSRSEEDGTRRAASWPDGVEVFGGFDEMLEGDMRDPLEPTVIDTARERIARYIHLSYQAGVAEAAKLARRENAGSLDARKAEQTWRVLAPEFRDSCRHAADHLWTKARALRGRIVYEPARTDTLALSEEDFAQLTALEHQRWVDERLLAGWTHAEKRVDVAKQHPNLIPYDRLPSHDREIDRTMAARMDAALTEGGLALRREYVVGITGHRQIQGRPLDAAYVRREIAAALREIVADHPNEVVVLYTALAPGSDSIAVDAAKDVGIPYTAVLPLPFEASRIDYEDEEGGIGRFLKLTAGADRVIELPLLFGDLAEVSPDRDGRSPCRDQQYALAGGYIASRCHTLLAVWNGEPARGLGGTGDVVGWASKGAIPEEYSLPGPFAPPSHRCVIRIIKPSPELEIESQAAE
ncbi:MAG: RyR domain-containing protein [Pseudomonadota bacterium]